MLEKKITGQLGTLPAYHPQATDELKPVAADIVSMTAANMIWWHSYSIIFSEIALLDSYLINHSSSVL